MAQSDAQNDGGPDLPSGVPPGAEYQVVVVGAGAAGLVAAERAAVRGRKVLLLEKNRRPGVKILMSGGTRCNLTQATDRRGIVKAYGTPGQFLHSALASLSPQELIALVEAEGVPTKVEQTGKVFPVSNRAADVLGAFMRRLQRSGCELALEEPLLDVERCPAGFRLTTARRKVMAQTLIVTTGGKSYPASGTTGDGYRWAEQFGHTLVPARPALVPITTPAPWVQGLTGVTVPDVELRVIDPASAAETPASGKSCLEKRRGSLLFTHFGLSGPVVLDASRAVSGHPDPARLELWCDFLPETKAESLAEQVAAACAGAGRKTVGAILPSALPRRLGEALLAAAEVPADCRTAELSKAARAAMVKAIKQSVIPVSGTRGFAKAEVTAGGVALDEVDSRSMQSKLVPGLYWAGEVLDLDGPIGGYNFQAAFSTGWLAGISV